MALVAEYDRMEGDLITLERVGEADIDTLFQRFQEPNIYMLTGLKKPPTRANFEEDVITDQTLIVWEMIPEGTRKSVGYSMFVTYDGPPYVAFFFEDGKLDIEIAGDAMQLLVHAFFKYQEEPQLFTFVLQPVPEEVHARLTEAGFDLMEDHPTVDPKKEATYVIERHTYNAYYGEEEDEEEEELNFDED
jgi:hypothetical protein